MFLDCYCNTNYVVTPCSMCKRLYNGYINEQKFITKPCSICNRIYNILFVPFIEIFSINTKNNNNLITYNLCNHCINNILSLKCTKCKLPFKVNFNEHIYIDFKSTTIFCKNCYDIQYKSKL